MNCNDREAIGEMHMPRGLFAPFVSDARLPRFIDIEVLSVVVVV
jgi:hypothetical protein